MSGTLGSGLIHHALLRLPQGVTGRIHHAVLTTPHTTTATGRVHHAVLSTPAAPAQAAASGVRQLTGPWWDVEVRQLITGPTWA
ncbi:hypothetical protein ACFVH6_36315 [Spirillospora sp. NPDC127200]